MEIYTSYFYQVRFFHPHFIPLSTAKWDPKWFHDFQPQRHTFVDKRGVINGLRADPFVPDDCGDSCRECRFGDPANCDFMQRYRCQLSHLDFNEMMQRFESIAKRVKKVNHYISDPIIILLVHEAPTNPCSERIVIQDWFKGFNYPIKEWEPLDGI